MGEVYDLGGRKFAVLGVSTLGHDIWFRALRRTAGLVDLVQGEGERAADFVERILDQLAASGKTFQFLGGLLVPEGTGPEGWTPELAEDTGRFIAGLTGEKDKAQVRMLISQVAIDFFVNGMTSLWRSASSSRTDVGSHPGSTTIERESMTAMPVGAT